MTTALGGGRQLSRRRWVGIGSLIGVTTVLLIVGLFAIWANRLLFSPDNWSSTSTQLLENDNIRSTTANYVVDQIYANVNVAGLIKSGLPPRFQPLAGPAAGALRNVAVQGVDTALTRPRVQSLWAKANRAADQTFVNIVQGGKGPVKINQGAVSLNLAAIVDDIASRLGLPPNLGAKLPSSAANVTVFKSKQLKLIQDGGNAIQGLAFWLTAIVPILYALALLLAPGYRRRTLMTVGFAAVLGGVAALLGRHLLESQIPGSLTHDASMQQTISAVVSIGTGLLAQVAGACILIGATFIVAAWFAGPARLASWGRRAITPFMRQSRGRSYAVALGIMALIFIWDPIPATGKPVGIIVFTVLALLGTDVLRRQVIQEFPDARPGDAARDIRARLARLRGRREGMSAAGVQESMPDQLRRLADLRADGSITADEYELAKARLLHG